MLSFVLFVLAFPLFLFSNEGIKYTHLKIPTSSFLNFITKSQSVHVIEVDPLLYEIKPVKALDDGIGRESVLSLSTRYQAIASVNGGFFAMGEKIDGQARGTLKIQDWYSLPFKPRGCLGWSSKDQSPKIDRLLVNIQGVYGQTTISIDGLNRNRKEGEVILFTPCFHRTTLTNPDGEELIVVEGVIEKIIKGGSSKVPENGCVLSIQAKHPLFGKFETGMTFSFSTQTTPQIEGLSFATWDSFDYIVGGGPLLLNQGFKIIDFNPEETVSNFLTKKHARTAIGILPNANWVFVVVDKIGLFDGMTIYELSDFMAGLGCLDALNLDGGGSSTMVFEGSIKNIPFGDKEEAAGQQAIRLVSDAILISPKKK